jgi:hypothetical protein
MAAGLGFKDFTTGEVLTAGDVDGYLMQGIWVFASAAARDAAVTSPQEGNFAFTKDTNGLWYYDGAAWVASGATGDIEGVTAGIGISGGGTSGTVTVTNSMATAIDAKGDLVVGTGADTFAKLTVGANGTTLVADSAEATGLKWATAAAGGGMTLLATLTLTGSSVTSSSFSSAYKQLFIYYKGVYASTATDLYIRFNADTGSNYYYRRVYSYSTTVAGEQAQSQTYWRTGGVDTSSTAKNTTNGFVTLMNPSDTDFVFGTIQHYRNNSGTDIESAMNVLLYDNSAAITSTTLFLNSGTFSGGTAYVYGVN